MPEENTRSYRKLIFVSLFGLLILGSFLTTSYFYSGLQEKLWKNELTRKAVIAALSFTASPTTEETLNESIQRLKTNLEEINEISIYRRVGAKFQAVASTKQELIGETVTDNQMDLSFEKRMPVPLLEIQKSYDNGNTRESHLVNVYTPLNDSSYLLHLKFSTDDVYLLRLEDTRNYWITVVILSIFLIIYILYSSWQLGKGWKLYSIWKAVAKSKDDLLSMAAHDMNAPLTAIKASISVFLDDFAVTIPPQGKNLISKAYSITQGLIDLMEEILTVSRFERGKIEIYPRPISLQTVAQEEVTIFEEKAKIKGLSISFEQPILDLPKVVADPEKIKEVMSNFISNAIKYSQQGTIKIYLDKTQKEVSFHVKDQGEGIAPKDLTKLFQRFTRLKSTSKEGGTGLGLYISRLIIEAHYGKIWAESGIGEGSVFSFSLPIPKRLPPQ